MRGCPVVLGGGLNSPMPPPNETCSPFGEVAVAAPFLNSDTTTVCVLFDANPNAGTASATHTTTIAPDPRPTIVCMTEERRPDWHISVPHRVVVASDGIIA